MVIMKIFKLEAYFIYSKESDDSPKSLFQVAYSWRALEILKHAVIFWKMDVFTNNDTFDQCAICNIESWGSRKEEGHGSLPVLKISQSLI